MFVFSSFISNSYYVQNISLPNGIYGLTFPLSINISADNNHYLICEFSYDNSYNIIQVDLDGSNMQLINLDVSAVFITSINTTADSSHYLFTSSVFDNYNVIFQMNLDTTNITEFIGSNALLNDSITPLLQNPYGIYLSADNTHYLITNNVNNSIIKVDLYGQNPVVFMNNNVLLEDGSQALLSVTSICVSIDKQHYLITNLLNNIIQVNLDGTNPIVLLDSNVLLPDGNVFAPFSISLSNDSKYYLVCTIYGIWKMYVSANVPMTMKSLFTDNSKIYYKPGSLSSCGVGTVRNSSIKSKRI